VVPVSDKVFVTRIIPDGGLNTIKAAFETDVWEHEKPPTKEELIERAKDCTALVSLLSDSIDREVIEALPNLKVIAQYAVGYNNIDLDAAHERGIVVTNTPGVLTETTADLTWALILAASRRLPEADAYVREGSWQVAWGPRMLLGKDIHGATLGIIGLGRIGSAVARRAKGYSMTILYHSRSETATTVQMEAEVGACRTSLETLLKASDIVTLHVPLTPDTQGLIGETELAMMKPGAILINTSRGQVVDESALYKTLTNGHLFAAGLDVFQQEPINMDNPLLGLRNVVVLPHIGSASITTRSEMSAIVAKNLIASLKGEEPPNPVV
jgi:glyoxylate reductase